MKNYVLCVCGAMLLCSAVDILMPSKSYKNIIKIICAVFVISTIISPIKDIITLNYKPIELGDFMYGADEFSRSVEQSRRQYETELTDDGADIVAKELTREIEGALKVRAEILYVDGRFTLTEFDKENLDMICDYARENFAFDIEVKDES